MNKAVKLGKSLTPSKPARRPDPQRTTPNRRLLLGAGLLIFLGGGWIFYDSSLPKPLTEMEKAGVQAERAVERTVMEARAAAAAPAATQPPSYQAIPIKRDAWETTQKAVTDFPFAKSSHYEFKRHAEVAYTQPELYAVVFQEPPQQWLLDRWKKKGLTLGEMFGDRSYLVQVPSKEAFNLLNDFEVAYLCKMTQVTAPTFTEQPPACP